MNAIQHLKYQLSTLANHEPSDFDYPEIEVGYENNDGSEVFATVCVIELADRAYHALDQLDAQLKAEE